MKIETYKEKFVELTEQAMQFSSHYKSIAELQKEITLLSNEAVVFYKTNSDHKESDYQLRIDIFLEFDNFLKCLKKDFEPQNQANNKSSFFKKLKQAKKANTYESIPSLESSVTL
ncbi:Uncharacterised protein [Legionella steigerwaltii]|uniref:Uncharacterized protein n=1 Tax=Legionella steigerwaltii TaxID=460 RepID=A0A378L9V2_9GAMM|nr:hypothetical protein [Legionella steigerwaltii]KTD77443.1 hypothetical protein Lstg_1800 [Legionella steigerwaltii]STY22702.1 Uncharacterised protein [Legionella steigerwaltii]